MSIVNPSELVGRKFLTDDGETIAFVVYPFQTEMVVRDGDTNRFICRFESVFHIDMTEVGSESDGMRLWRVRMNARPQMWSDEPNREFRFFLNELV